MKHKRFYEKISFVHPAIPFIRMIRRKIAVISGGETETFQLNHDGILYFIFLLLQRWTKILPLDYLYFIKYKTVTKLIKK